MSRQTDDGVHEGEDRAAQAKAAAAADVALGLELVALVRRVGEAEAHWGATVDRHVVERAEADTALGDAHRALADALKNAEQVPG